MNGPGQPMRERAVTNAAMSRPGMPDPSGPPIRPNQVWACGARHRTQILEQAIWRHSAR
ncbi:hypothetical protein ACI2LC_34930 [Nonomuraea wenchangensis]|uniref:hypothetical protein n=1 Tax=Nonomuraea wenchangensis TaxID=568860 RepID=UPI0037B51743